MVEIASGGNYGQRQEQEELAAVNRGPATPAGPTPPPSGPPGVEAPAGGGGGGGGGGPVPTPRVPGADVFGATARPGEPITEGVDDIMGGNSTPTTDQVLRLMYAAHPSPYILALIEEAGESRAAPPPQPREDGRLPIGLPTVEDIEAEARQVPPGLEAEPAVETAATTPPTAEEAL